MKPIDEEGIWDEQHPRLKGDTNGIFKGSRINR